MTLMQQILEYVMSHPRVTTKIIAEHFPAYPLAAIQGAIYRLKDGDYMTREGAKNQYVYSFNANRPAIGPAPVVENPKAKELIALAETLESKGLYMRAATIWLEAFTASRSISEREVCRKRRKKCLVYTPCTHTTERMWDMAGRFSGDV